MSETPQKKKSKPGESAGSLHQIPADKEAVMNKDVVDFPMISLQNPPHREMDFAAGTVWLINKPPGWTSFRVVGLIRKLTGVKKVGHAGTLDPLATGLLILCTGKATKAITSLIGADKRYECEIRLGESTPSYDSETEPDAALPCSHVTEAMITFAIREHFTGQVNQVPPMYSALKHKGQPLYKYARKGEEISRPAREVTLFETRLTGFRDGKIDMDVHCSKGTYIRTLAHDLGKKLGTLAHLTALRRTAIGPYNAVDALDVKTVLNKLDPDGNYTISF